MCVFFYPLTLLNLFPFLKGKQTKLLKNIKINFQCQIANKIHPNFFTSNMLKTALAVRLLKMDNYLYQSLKYRSTQ